MFCSDARRRSNYYIPDSTITFHVLQYPLANGDAVKWNSGITELRNNRIVTTKPRPENLRLTAPSICLTAPSIRLKAPSIRLTAPSIRLTAPSIRLTCQNSTGSVRSILYWALADWALLGPYWALLGEGFRVLSLGFNSNNSVIPLFRYSAFYSVPC